MPRQCRKPPCQARISAQSRLALWLLSQHLVGLEEGAPSQLVRLAVQGQHLPCLHSGLIDQLAQDFPVPLLAASASPFENPTQDGWDFQTPYSLELPCSWEEAQ